ncbi:hypothetical protein E2C01_094002 [Portunus trituberculatus]|uniref:Uncharacterized protein n=1 Tax=Portunus trituberculatus TaxID=210409 RepID=A0A5B7JWE7_PORTR|nr:hypothetical protein [Portunus trituberculatus]
MVFPGLAPPAHPAAHPAFQRRHRLLDQENTAYNINASLVPTLAFRLCSVQYDSLPFPQRIFLAPLLHTYTQTSHLIFSDAGRPLPTLPCITQPCGTVTRATPAPHAGPRVAKAGSSQNSYLWTAKCQKSPPGGWRLRESPWARAVAGGSTRVREGWGGRSIRGRPPCCTARLPLTNMMNQGRGIECRQIVCIHAGAPSWV